MATSNIRAAFSCGLDVVWEAVTSLTDYEWRSDLSKIAVRGENKFVEYTKDGFSTVFTITAKVPMERYEFEMENENMKGRWTGLFYRENGRTVIDFTEAVTAKRFFLKPFVKVYLKKQQGQYVADLRKKVEK